MKSRGTGSRRRGLAVTVTALLLTTLPTGMAAPAAGNSGMSVTGVVAPAAGSSGTSVSDVAAPGLPTPVRASLAANYSGPAVEPEQKPSDDYLDPLPADVLPIDVAITQITPQILVPGTDLAVHATLTNTSTEVMTDATVALAFSSDNLNSRYRFHQWANAAPTDPDFVGQTKVTVPLPEPLAPGQSVAVDLVLPADQLNLPSTLTAWGPHPLAVEVTGVTGRLGIARTFALWAPPGVSVSPTGLSIAIPLVPEAVYDPDPFAGLLAEPEHGAPAVPAAPGPSAADQLTEILNGRLSTLANLASIAPVAVAVDPFLVTEATAAGGSAATWAQQVTNLLLAGEGIPLLAHDPDVAAAVHTTTAALAGARTRAIEAWTALTPVPPTNVAWLAFGLQDPTGASWLTSHGYTALLSAPTELNPTPDLNYTPTGLTTLPITTTTTTPVVVPDEVVSQLLANPADTTPAMAAQRLLAELMSITEERPNDPRHVAATLPWLWNPDPAIAEAQLTALTGAPWVDLQPFTTLLAQEPPNIERLDLPEKSIAPAELSAAEVEAIHSDQATWTAFAQITPEPEQLTAPVDATVSVLLSAAARADHGIRDRQRLNLTNAILATTGAVSTLPGSDIRIGGSDVRLPVVVNNGLTVPVTVDIQLTAATALQVPDTVPVTVGGGDTVTAWVPVQAIANGPAVVDVQLMGPDGTMVANGTQLHVNVRAEWDTWATMVIAIGLTLIVFFGVLRTIRRRRGTRAEQMATEGIP
jgi:hypothetical protein